jgi:hypothetical protein
MQTYLATQGDRYHYSKDGKHALCSAAVRLFRPGTPSHRSDVCATCFKRYLHQPVVKKRLHLARKKYREQLADEMRRWSKPFPKPGLPAH